MRLKIGEFAKIGLVSVSALRFYNETGLLKPAEVDRWTGYRYYNLDQLPALHRILAFKDLGLSLEQIKQLMGEELPTEQIRGMLRLKRAELQAEMEDVRQKLDRVEARLQQIEMEGKMSDYDVIVKKVEPERVAIVRDVIPSREEINKTLNRLFDEVIQYIEDTNAGFAGPATTLWFESESMEGNMPVGAAMPTRGAVKGNERVHIEELEGIDQAVSTLHRGPFTTLSGAYDAVLRYIESNGYRISGPSRELNLEYDRNGDPNKYLTEIQIPVEKA